MNRIIRGIFTLPTGQPLVGVGLHVISAHIQRHLGLSLNSIGGCTVHRAALDVILAPLTKLAMRSPLPPPPPTANKRRILGYIRIIVDKLRLTLLRDSSHL